MTHAFIADHMHIVMPSCVLFAYKIPRLTEDRSVVCNAQTYDICTVCRFTPVITMINVKKLNSLNMVLEAKSHV